MSHEEDHGCPASIMEISYLTDVGLRSRRISASDATNCKAYTEMVHALHSKCSRTAVSVDCFPGGYFVDLIRVCNNFSVSMSHRAQKGDFMRMSNALLGSGAIRSLHELDLSCCRAFLSADSVELHKHLHCFLWQAQALSSLKLPMYAPRGLAAEWYTQTDCAASLASLRKVHLTVPDSEGIEPGFKILANWVGAAAGLEEVLVETMSANDLNAGVLVPLLARPRHLKALIILCAIGKQFWEALAACPSAGQVQVLRFQGLPSSDAMEVKAFTRALHRLTRLRETDVSGADSYDEDCNVLAPIVAWLADNPRCPLRKLSCNAHAGDDCPQLVESIVGRSPSLRELVLGHVDSPSVAAVGRGLCLESCNLLKLTLSEAWNDDAGMDDAYKTLADGLELNDTLLDFKLSCDDDFDPTEGSIFGRVALGAVRSSSLRRVDFAQYYGGTQDVDIQTVLREACKSMVLVYLALPDVWESTVPVPGLSTTGMLTRQRSIQDAPCKFDLSKYISDAGDARPRDSLAILWHLPHFTEIWLELAQEASVYSICLALQHNPLLRTIYIDGYDLGADSCQVVLETITEHCPGLQRLLFRDCQSAVQARIDKFLATDHSSAVYRWMTDVPTPPRAACVLRMLCHMDQNPSLDRARAMDYCGRGFRYAVESGNAMQVVVVGQAMLELMEREDAPRGLIRECTDLHAQASLVARGRYGLRSSDPGGEWTGAARRCQSMVELSCGWRRGGLLGWRRAVEAKRDAGRVFASARDGRPLELGKRLVLGRLAGALQSLHDLEHGGRVLQVTAVEAALLGGHMDCVKVLREVSGSI